MSTPAPWERQLNETPKAFEAFVIYRDQGANRSVRAASEVLGKSKVLLEKWAAQNRWMVRCRAFDTEQDRLTRVQAGKDRDAMNRRHAQLATGVQAKVVEALAKLDVAKMKPADVARLLDVATKLERAARGEPDRHEITGRDGGPVQVDVAGLTDEQKRELLTAAVAEAQARIAREALPGAGDEDEDPGAGSAGALVPA